MKYSETKQTFKMRFHSTVVADKSQSLMDDIITGRVKTIDNDRIDVIASSVFSYRRNLVSIKADNAVKVMTSAFKGCEKLQNVTLPKVEILYDDCFKDCPKLSSPLESMKSLKRIGNSCFQNSSFHSFTSNTVEQIGVNAFNGSSGWFVKCPNARVGGAAFQNNKTLEYCVLSGEFGGVASVTTGEGADTDKGEKVFDGCDSLTILILTKTTVFDPSKLGECRKNLGTLNIPNASTITSDGWYWLGNNKDTIRLTEPTSNCPNLAGITLPYVSTAIPYRAFWKTSKLVSITIGTSNIGGEVFLNSGIRKFYGKPLVIYDSAFTNCNQLFQFNSEVMYHYIFDGTTSIRNNVFHRDVREVHNGSAWVIDFGKNLTSIGSTAFKNFGWDGTYRTKAIFRNTSTVCSLASEYSFAQQYGETIFPYDFYVPDNLVEAYKTAPHWSVLAAQIHPLSELHL